MPGGNEMYIELGHGRRALAANQVRLRVLWGVDGDLEADLRLQWHGVAGGAIS